MAAMNMNKEMFDKALQEQELVLVDYWAPWCSYCRRIGPAYDKVAQQYSDILAAKINIDEEPVLAQQEQIEVIPTLVLYRKGKAVASIVAPESKAMIDKMIQGVLEQGESSHE